jgi:hypothetical protein
MKKTEICLFCNVDYIPNRRGHQKFCSASCRSGHWRLKQKNKRSNKEAEVKTAELPTVDKKKEKKEKMSLAGVGNAVVGITAVEVAKSIFTPLDKKPATKKDIEELKAFIKRRYLLINNLKKDVMGRCPYYDVETGNVVYLRCS